MLIPESFRPHVIALFEQMDHAYDAVAKTAGFTCRGCKYNCCLTRFYHHTLLEYLYLKSGLNDLADDVLDHVKTLARAALEQMAYKEQEKIPIRVMCPLNQNGRCLLYAYRPMICRLHGISHTLRRPDGQILTGPGCDDFYGQCGRSEVRRLDRTPLYTAMAYLEGRLRNNFGFTQKIKMTVAEIILDGSIRLDRIT